MVSFAVLIFFRVLVISIALNRFVVSPFLDSFVRFIHIGIYVFAFRSTFVL